MHPAAIHAIGLAITTPKYPSIPGSVIAAIALAINSVMLLIIGIAPEPKPWQPVLYTKIRPRKKKNFEIVLT